MIRFFCEYCAHKIRVRDKDIGRQGKCPKCGKVIRIPTESTIIEFNCENCDRVISVPKSHAGRRAVCPQCNIQFIIPSPQFPCSVETQEFSDDLIARSTDSPHGLTLLDVPEEYKLKDLPVVQSDISEDAVDQQQESEGDSQAQETESVGQRKLPWFIDIFLYPINRGGLSTIGIILFLRLLTDFASLGLILFCGCVGLLLGLIIKIVIYYSYVYWYFTECVRDSANGGLRAPVILASMPGLGAMVLYFFRIFACYAFTIGPATFYWGYTSFADVEMNIFIILALSFYGMFFFPMGILAVVMFDSINGLRPVLLVRSISSTIFSYCGLVILFYGLGILFVVLYSRITFSVRDGFLSWLMLSYILSNLFLLYALFISGHLLGRFFYRFEDKLYWEV